jgi:TPR repeat protein
MKKHTLTYAIAAAMLALSLAAPAAEQPKGQTTPASSEGTAASAGSYIDGSEAYLRGDYPTAMRILRPLDEQGNIKAQYVLGSMYYFGKGVQRNYAQAFRWWQAAAVGGHSGAQFALGRMYIEGAGVPQNYAAAVK